MVGGGRVAILARARSLPAQAGAADADNPCMADSPSPNDPDRRGRRDRRAPAGPVGSLRWIKSILARPLTLERRADGLHVTLVERRRSPEVIQAESMARLREELQQRLLAQEHEHVDRTMRHLVFVHEVLGRHGWPGLQAMESRVLRRAGVQLKMLLEHEPSPRLARFVDKLRLLQAGAEAREERLQASGAATGSAKAGPPELDERDVTRAPAHAIEVSEVSAEEFHESQRIWDATAPAELDGLVTVPAQEPAR
jgi:hypothetical protein